MESSKYIIKTPIEKYKVGNLGIYVKREDLACIPPGPPFAKVRGLYPKLLDLKRNGINTVGYMETTVSMAGWGISFFCKELGMKAVIFEPKYKDGIDRDLQEHHRRIWKKFGATVVPLENPNRLSINFYRARRALFNNCKNSFMLPQGLPFEETVEEVSEEFMDIKEKRFKTIIGCAGSGTMLAGVVRGLIKSEADGTDVIGILVSPKSEKNMREKIIEKAGGFKWELMKHKIVVLDLGYNYTQKEESKAPFPCNPYYDRKAWKYLVDYGKDLRQPILFWNIGA